MEGYFIAFAAGPNYGPKDSNSGMKKSRAEAEEWAMNCLATHSNVATCTILEAVAVVQRTAPPVEIRNLTRNMSDY